MYVSFAFGTYLKNSTTWANAESAFTSKLQPTPDPSQEGNKTSAPSRKLPSSGGVGVGATGACGLHLISQNIANNKAKVANPRPAVSIFNFHYASPPETVAMNYDLNKVIGDNETGFRGTNDLPYRVEAWSFILAGGGLFNNLDYSFTVRHEDGTFVYPSKQPGGGNPVFRRQMKILHQFIRGFDFVKMKPLNSALSLDRKRPPPCGRFHVRGTESSLPTGVRSAPNGGAKPRAEFSTWIRSSAAPA